MCLEAKSAIVCAGWWRFPLFSTLKTSCCSSSPSFLFQEVNVANPCASYEEAAKRRELHSVSAHHISSHISNAAPEQISGLFISNYPPGKHWVAQPAVHCWTPELHKILKLKLVPPADFKSLAFNLFCDVSDCLWCCLSSNYVWLVCFLWICCTQVHFISIKLPD